MNGDKSGAGDGMRSADALDATVYYLRSERGAVGPVAARVLRQWHVDGRLGARTPVSRDARSWAALESTPLLADFTPAAAADRAIGSMEGLHRRLVRFAPAFHGAVIASTAAAMAGCYGLIVLVCHGLWPYFPAWLLGLASLVPCLLTGAWAGCAFGRGAAAWVGGLDSAARRNIARARPWSRRDPDWPLWFQQWLYTGDWLAEPRLERSESYLALIREGDDDDNDPECDDRAWRQALSAGPAGGLEAGAAYCENFRQPVWPSWAPGAPAGAGAAEIRRAGGGAWLRHLGLRVESLTGMPAAESESGWRFWPGHAAGGERGLLAAWTFPDHDSRRARPLAGEMPECAEERRRSA